MRNPMNYCSRAFHNILLCKYLQWLCALALPAVAQRLNSTEYTSCGQLLMIDVTFSTLQKFERVPQRCVVKMSPMHIYLHIIYAYYLFFTTTYCWKEDIFDRRGCALHAKHSDYWREWVYFHYATAKTAKTIDW